MEAVPVTGIPPWDRGMGQDEMRIFRFDLGQPVRVSKHKPRKSRNAVGQVGEPWGSFSPPILAIVPAVPAHPCMRGGTGTGTCRATRAVRVSLAPCRSRLTGGSACMADDLPHRALHPGGEINAGGSGGRAPRCVIGQLTTSSRDDLLNTVRAGTLGSLTPRRARGKEPFETSA